MREIWISLGFIGLCGLVLVGSLLVGNPQNGDAIAAEAPDPLQPPTTLVVMADPTEPEQSAAEPVAQPEVKTDSGLKYTDLVEGKGAVAEAGQIVYVHYIGMLADGTEFDNSYNRGPSFSFLLGKERVIKGWDEGVAGMKVGGKRKLVIPYQLAYGERGLRGIIPPKATLIFTVELLDVQ